MHNTIMHYHKKGTVLTNQPVEIIRIKSGKRNKTKMKIFRQLSLNRIHGANQQEQT